MRDILQTLPPGASCDLEVEISAHKEGLCERRVVFYSNANGLVEHPVLFRAVGLAKQTD